MVAQWNNETRTAFGKQRSRDYLDPARLGDGDAQRPSQRTCQIETDIVVCLFIETTNVILVDTELKLS